MADSQHSTFEPFSWLNSEEAKGFPGSQFAEVVSDISTGMRLVLQLVHESDLSEDDAAATPLLSVNERGTLNRLAIATLGLLHDTANEHIEWVNTHGVDWVASGAFDHRRLMQQHKRKAA